MVIRVEHILHKQLDRFNDERWCVQRCTMHSVTLDELVAKIDACLEREAAESSFLVSPTIPFKVYSGTLLNMLRRDCANPTTTRFSFEALTPLDMTLRKVYNAGGWTVRVVLMVEDQFVLWFSPNEEVASKWNKFF